MSIAKAWLAEFEQEAAVTRRCLERVPDGKFDWQPHPKSMSLGQLASHIAAFPKGIMGMALQDSFDFADMPSEFPSGSTAAELLALHDESAAFVRAHLPTVSDEALGQNWQFLKHGAVIVSMPRGAVLRMMLLNHIVHHRGQLSVYLRLLDVPVPSIYGPSADENPFG